MVQMYMGQDLASATNVLVYKIVSEMSIVSVSDNQGFDRYLEPYDI